MSNDEVFKLDRKTLKKLHQKLISIDKEYFGNKTKISAQANNLIPNINQLEEIISVMFWASTQLEEGRQLRFRVIYSPYSGFEHLELRFDFDSLKLWDVEEVRRLAPAVMPPNGAICVYPLSYSKEDLYIQGLSATTFVSVTFEVVEPARLIVSYPLSSKVVEITGQKTGFINEDWNRRGIKLLSTYESEEKNQTVKNMLSFLYSNMTTEILNRIRLLRHGGTIVFVQDDNLWKKSIEKPIAYSCQNRYNGIRHIENALNKELQEVVNESIEDKIKDRKITEIATRKMASPLYKAFIGDAARNVAYLTAVDGATILSKNFDVLAFGTKIKEMQRGRKSETVTKIIPYESSKIPTSSSLIHEFRGKRHLSTARFVMNNPNSVAFTVSQDGGITGFVIEDEKLFAYTGLELLI